MAPSVVSADLLPTVQIDGVVWSQVVVGNNVYAGGAFGTARPAGAAAGVGTVERKNLLSYDITTGVLNSAFVPKLNGSALVVAASPDGSRVYVGGNFTIANTVTRQRIVAYDTATGQVVQSFAPTLDSSVNAIHVTDAAVYVGGSFTTANGVARSRLAAFSPADGALLNWAPTANNRVDALVLTPDRTKLIVGGKFTSFNNVTAKGLQAVDPTTAAILPWSATATIRNGGSSAGITSLTTDGTNIYGTGYVFAGGTQGNLEGAFSAEATTGKINWIEDCHGDTYSGYPMGGAFYTVTHAHSCDNIGGFPEVTPRVGWRAQAFTTEATGVIHQNSVGVSSYFNWAGHPAPSPLSWYPTLEQGTASGQGQAAWSVTGNGKFVVIGGEFPSVNSIKQQGLVRFAVRSMAPNKMGPSANALLKPSLTSSAANSIRLAWQTTWDKDDRALTYKVFRNSNLLTPIHTVSANSTFWDKPWLTFTDTAVTAGKSYSYRVFAYDPAGNATSSGSAVLTAGSVDTGNAYVDQIKADGASMFWRLDEPAGSAVYDSAAGYDGVAGSAVRRGAAGPVGTDAASTFVGTSASTLASQYNMYGPRVFSAQAFFRTTSTTGGQILGFGTATTALSTINDRAVYLTNAGKVAFDLYPGVHKSVTSPKTYNDGLWHQVTATVTATTMTLYVDGVAVATRSDSVYPWFQAGHWRVGGDKLAGMTGAPTSNYFTGDIAEVAIFPQPLTAAQVANQFAVATGGASAAPTARFTTAVTDRSASFDGSTSSDPDGTVTGYAWKFGDGSTGTGIAPGHDYAANGTYNVTLTVTDNSGLTASVTQPVVVNRANAAPVAAFTASTSLLTAVLSAAASSDSDGTVVGYAWNFGDGSTQALSAVSAASHAFAASGTYQVTLTVTDSDGATSSTSNSVTVQAGNVAPTASFTSSAAGLTLSVDGAGSSDADGAITQHAWDFGDENTGTGTTTSHTYAAAGSYQVSLTVTDDRAGTATQTRTVVVAAPAAAGFAADSFSRTTAGGLGSADVGGTWSVTGSPANYATNDAAGVMTLSAGGATTTGMLAAVRALDVDVATDVTIDKVANGGGVYLSLVGRRLNNNDYRAKVRVLSNGSVTISLTRVIGTLETTLVTSTVAGLTVAGGDTLRIRLQLTGTGTTALTAKTWKATSAEPAGWQTTAVDGTAALQVAGGVGVAGYLSGSNTVLPLTVSVDNFSAGSPTP